MRSMTFGVMPTKKVFHEHWLRTMNGQESYSYTFRGSDAASAGRARVPSEGRFSEKQIYAIVKKLRDSFFKKGDENAGSMASSLLYSLDFEWI